MWAIFQYAHITWHEYWAALKLFPVELQTTLIINTIASKIQLKKYFNCYNLTKTATDLINKNFIDFLMSPLHKLFGTIVVTIVKKYRHCILLYVWNDDKKILQRYISQINHRSPNNNLLIFTIFCTNCLQTILMYII